MDNILKSIGIVILAAGRGTRLKATAEQPKVLLPVLGKPIIKHLLDNIKTSRVSTRPVIVIAPDLYVIRDYLGSSFDYAIQESQLGTGHAVLAAKSKLSSYENILVLYGDHPLISAKTVDKLTESHLNSGVDITLATIKVPHFDDWYSVFDNYGRILRNSKGVIVGIREVKDATDKEKTILEVNPGYYVFKKQWLWPALNKLSRDNAQKEYLLTDLIGIAISEGRKINDIPLDDPEEALGINTMEQMELVEKIMQKRLDEAARSHTMPLPI